MPLQIKHQSEGIVKTANGMGKKLTYYGTRAEVEEYISDTRVGNIDIVPGYVLETIEAKSTPGGAIWEVDLSFNQPLDAQGSPIIPAAGPTEHMLNTRMISIPLESLTATYWTNLGYAYRTSWNYALAALGSNTRPSWYLSATTLVIPPADREKYAWLSNENDVANMPSKNSQYWGILEPKTKPGVDAFYFPVYEITEIGKHKTQQDAGWVAALTAGKVFTPRLYNFGITGGNWLSMGGSVQYDGKNWVATVTYQHSPSGWDPDLYK